MTDASKTPETIDSLRQQLRVAKRVTQAAIDCTKSWDTILDELVWERPDIDAHDIPADHLHTMIARYPHHAEALADFTKRWNSDKPLSDAELADIEVDEQELKRSTASCLMMLKWAMRIRKAETKRDEARAERDAAVVANCPALCIDFCNAYQVHKYAAQLEAERDALRVALTHMQTCRSCAEGSWEDCDSGRDALALLARIDSDEGRKG